MIMISLERSRADGGLLLFDDRQSLGIGDLCRYRVTADKSQLEEKGIDVDHLFVRVKNEESPLLRPIYLTGPYACYVDVRPHKYDEDRKFDSSETIQFTSDLRPNEHFKAKLHLNENARMESGLYSWIVDVISQVSVSALPKVEYRLRIGTTKAAAKHVAETSTMKGFTVEKWDTQSLWNLPPKYPEKPVHLVILTHGIFSNIGCDMLYMKDKIEQKCFAMEERINPNVVLRGCMENVGKSARGVRYLGTRVGQYVIAEIERLNETYKVDKISFIGHSLGGPVQAMAIHYIAVKRPDLFDPNTGVKPINFIAFASPFLGVVGDFPRYVSLALDVGALGITGRDLTLRHTPIFSRNGLGGSRGPSRLHKLILEALPQKPALEVLQRLVHRTVYANVLHDGIVPLRTAALLYLDWNSLSKVHQIRKQKSLAMKKDSSEAGQAPESAVVYPSSSLDDNHNTASSEIASTVFNEPSGVVENGEDGLAENEEEPLCESANRSGNSSRVEKSEEPSATGDSHKEKTTMGEIPVESMDKRAALQWLIPQGISQGKKYSKYMRTQTVDVSSESSESDTGLVGTLHVNQEEKKFVPPPAASTVMAAISVITSPVPTQKYIKDPSLRTDAIIHDKVYHPDELPPAHYMNRPFIKKVIYPNESNNRHQERIARAWQETMTWRKVLVDLKPDSHNNICVRRRFTNLFGNVVVHNMVETHFGVQACEKYATL
ncbi:hypothetical protein HG536_0A05800 [Torulaspora globosa]|uniref:DUF676 domain-containing protein n=1 Tax=Torulaspora globosa TaxID=48254 RepID=A0A7G3ZB79_9SACH|nr:uncharacterized protein HG536_0A05800 [Torulaspora globosa]QLL30765.1 hypothetical protein HG536_0A05800 [Torulaspora globosa]